MRVMVLHAHPVTESYNHALYNAVLKTLEANGHQVDPVDLYAEDFNPVMGREGRLQYHDVPENVTPELKPYVDRLMAAEGLVIVHPVWNYGFPAILKGFFDRVFLPGVSFRLVDGKVQPSLHNIRKVAAVTTYGGSRFRAIVMGDPPRRLIKRMLRATVKPGAPVTYLAHYAMNLSTDQTRKSFMSKVAASMDAF